MNYIFVKKVESLTEAMFSMDEPWRSRLLELVANQATGWMWEGRPPTRDQVTVWLGNGDLYQEVVHLLNAWQGNIQTI